MAAGRSHDPVHQSAGCPASRDLVGRMATTLKGWPSRFGCLYALDQDAFSEEVCLSDACVVANVYIIYVHVHVGMYICVLTCFLWGPELPSCPSLLPHLGVAVLCTKRRVVVHTTRGMLCVGCRDFSSLQRTLQGVVDLPQEARHIHTKDQLVEWAYLFHNVRLASLASGNLGAALMCMYWLALFASWPGAQEMHSPISESRRFFRTTLGRVLSTPTAFSRHNQVDLSSTVSGVIRSLKCSAEQAKAMSLMEVTSSVCWSRSLIVSPSFFKCLSLSCPRSSCHRWRLSPTHPLLMQVFFFSLRSPTPVPVLGRLYCHFLLPCFSSPRLVPVLVIALLLWVLHIVVVVVVVVVWTLQSPEGWGGGGGVTVRDTGRIWPPD